MGTADSFSSAGLNHHNPIWLDEPIVYYMLSSLMFVPKFGPEHHTQNTITFCSLLKLMGVLPVRNNQTIVYYKGKALLQPVAVVVSWTESGLTILLGLANNQSNRVPYTIITYVCAQIWFRASRIMTCPPSSMIVTRDLFQKIINER